MLNQFVCVGRLVNNIEKEEERKYYTLTLAIPRNFKNADGIYETDFIPCILWSGIGDTAIEYCRKGDLLGIKGRLESRDNKIVVVAEKVTFLSSKKED